MKINLEKQFNIKILARPSYLENNLYPLYREVVTQNILLLGINENKGKKMKLKENKRKYGEKKRK